MRRWCCLLGYLLICAALRVSAQTATEIAITPTPTFIPLPTDAATTPTPTFAPLLVVTPTPLPPTLSNLTFTTYTSKDRSFAFEYPTDWTVEQSDYYTTFTAPLTVGDLNFTVFNPRVVTVLLNNETDPVAGLRSLRQYFGLIPDNISPTTVVWRKAALAPLSIGTTGGGVAMLLQMSRGGYGLIFAVANQGQLNGFLPLIDTMIRTYDSPGSRRLATREQMSLNTYVGPREGILNSLITQKIIKPDTTLLDTIDTLDLSGDNPQFTSMAERLPENSVVMMGEMAFLPRGSGSYESCAFVLRVVNADASDTNQTLRHYLEVGLDQKGTLYYFDAGRNQANVISADVRQNVDLQRPHAFVLVLTNERMTIYLDGLNVADNVLVRGVAGYAGLSLRPASKDTHCLFRNVALYSMTPLPAGLCTVAPRGVTTSHIAPNTNSAGATQLTAETPQQVMAYLAPSGSQLRWWKLADGSWLREDSVVETGDCDNLPLVQ